MSDATPDVALTAAADSDVELALAFRIADGPLQTLATADAGRVELHRETNR